MNDETLHSVDETLVQRFEQAWKDEQRPALRNFLPPQSDPAYLATLEELVCIDIEFALKDAAATAPKPPHLAVIENYLPDFAELNDPRILKRLIREEAFVRRRLGYDAAYAEYRRRFPGAIQESDLQFRDKDSAVAPAASWNLAFGLLALQNGLISREQLVAAFAKWTSNKSMPLDQLLVDDGALDEATSQALRQLVELHIQRHGGDPQQTLMSLSGSDLPAAKAELAKLEDTDLHQSIEALHGVASIATTRSALGRVTSEGGRFRILRSLPGAKGGMGIISVARDEELGRQVALKQIIANKADQAVFRQKFQVEAEITGNLEHPGIVPIYGLGVGADGRPYYAMRLVHGDNLSVQIKEFHAALSSGAVDYNSVEFHGLIDRLIDVAQAIRYAHSRGVLHRDLKPGNILVGNYGETLVIDWGLARLPHLEEESAAPAPQTSQDSQAPLQIRSGSNVDATLQGQILGTVGYAPPEQLNGRVDLITERSDVYALGAILYQILVGQAPVTSEDSNLDDLIQDTIAGKITPPKRLRRAIPKSLSAVCMQALERLPADRYASVEDFIAEIEHWKADQPVTAAPDSIADRLMRLTRRYRSAALATAATLLGIAIVTGCALVFVNQARLNETAARSEAESLAKEKAELAERNQIVVDAFVAAFRSADPENEGVTSKMTALEVLEQALAQIETDEELSRDELTKATLLEAIAKSLYALGEYGRSLSAREQILEIKKAKLGLEHPDTLISMDNLAVGYVAAGRVQEALPLYEKTLRLARAKLGDEHPDTATIMGNLAGGYRAAGRVEEALPLYEESLRLTRANLGEEHLETLVRMDNLAMGYYSAGRVEEALQLFEQTFQVIKAKLGEDHPDTLISMTNLASGFQAAGQPDKALPLFEETLRLARAKLGNEHPQTLICMDNLAVNYAKAGRLEDSLPLFEETLRLTRSKVSDEHPDTLMKMNNLATAYARVGRLEEALPLFQETVRLRKTSLGDDHPETHVSTNNLVTVLIRQRNYEEAIPILEDWKHHFDIHKQPVKRARVETNRAVCLLELGQLGEAVAAANAALRIKEIEEVERLLAQFILATAQASPGDAGAEERLVEAYRALRKQLFTMDIDRRWYVPRACERVIKMQEAGERREQLRAWKAELGDVNAEIERLRKPKKTKENQRRD